MGSMDRGLRWVVEILEEEYRSWRTGGQDGPGIVVALKEYGEAASSADLDDPSSVVKAVASVKRVVDGKHIVDACGAMMCAAASVLSDTTLEKFRETVGDVLSIVFSEDAKTDEVVKTTLHLWRRYSSIKGVGRSLSSGADDKTLRRAAELFHECKGIFRDFDGWAGDGAVASVVVALGIVARKAGRELHDGRPENTHKDFIFGFINGRRYHP